MIIKVVKASTRTLIYFVTLQGGQGDVIDLSCVTARIMCKKNVGDKDSRAYISKSIVHPESNMCYFELTAEETAAMPIGRYALDFRLDYDNGAKVVLRQDTLLVIGGAFND